MTDDQRPKSSEEMLEEIRDWLDESQEDPSPPADDRPSAARNDAPAADTAASDEPPLRTPRRRAEPRRRDSSDAAVPAPVETRSSWDGMAPWMLLGLVFAAIGALLIVWGVTQFAETGSWIAHTGEVIAVDREDDSTTVTIAYEWNGTIYTFGSSAEDSAEVGDLFEIAVRPDDPSQATTQRDRIVVFVVRIVFGTLAVAAASVPIWWGRRLRRVDRY